MSSSFETTATQSDSQCRAKCNVSATSAVSTSFCRSVLKASRDVPRQSGRFGQRFRCQLLKSSRGQLRGYRQLPGRRT